MKQILTIGFLFLLGCGFFPEKVSRDDPQVQEMLKAAAAFDRTAYGFLPIEPDADFRIETAPKGRYDAMLHVHARTSRTIAFRRMGKGYRWIGEQEIFWGTKQYTTEDGTFFEELVLNYDIENVSGNPTNQLNISYSGEDPRLAQKRNLTLAEVQPILKEWHY